MALAFASGEDGTPAPKEGVECPSAKSAIARAKAVSVVEGGAVAFSRTGDPAVGEFAPAEILGRFGAVPDDLSEL